MQEISRAIEFGAYLEELNRKLDIFKSDIYRYHSDLVESAKVASIAEWRWKLYKIALDVQSEHLQKELDDISNGFEGARQRANTEYAEIGFAQNYVSKVGRKLEQLKRIWKSVDSDLFYEELRHYEKTNF